MVGDLLQKKLTILTDMSKDLQINLTDMPGNLQINITDIPENLQINLTDMPENLQIISIFLRFYPIFSVFV